MNNLCLTQFLIPDRSRGEVLIADFGLIGLDNGLPVSARRILNKNTTGKEPQVIQKHVLLFILPSSIIDYYENPYLTTHTTLKLQNTLIRDIGRSRGVRRYISMLPHAPLGNEVFANIH
ncbi:MAG: hypothetical protein HS127_09425 [Planctomycetia bacterium]|nr:hypothetical protein [Planctomycetia bacterium]